jgi:hypothetical protein
MLPWLDFNPSNSTDSLISLILIVFVLLSVGIILLSGGLFVLQGDTSSGLLQALVALFSLENRISFAFLPLT